MKDKDSFSIMCYLTLSMIGLSIILFIIFELGYLAPFIDFALVFLFFYNCWVYSQNKSFMALEWRYNVYFFCILVFFMYLLLMLISLFLQKRHTV